MTSAKVFSLSAALQRYPWGKPGESSAVADLARTSVSGFTVDNATTYAELWMGTHPRGPNTLPKRENMTLSSYLEQNPEAVGEKTLQSFPTPGQLPYLFKVLSVNRALSIQAHPNKPHAEQLHRERPDIYPDPNHKPEMAIALTPFEALCGFRPKAEIVGFLKNVPEFRNIIGETNAEELEKATEETEQGALKKCFSALVSSDKARVAESLKQLVTRLEAAESAQEDTSSAVGDLLLRLNSQYPGDVGCFSIYFLNRVLLQPGEAIFLQANLPHAYLAGDCLECMACSDNVVRAGLTPKYIDLDTLCGMLDYRGKPADANKFVCSPHPTDACVTVYSPPIPDFAVDQIKVPKSASPYTLPAVHSGSILLVIQGAASISSAGLTLSRGSVLFVSAGESVQLSVEEDLLVFRAYCDV